MSNSTETFTVLYFSILQEKAGKEEEMRTLTPGMTTKKLFDEISQELSLGNLPVRPSVNHQYADWETPINSGDVVVFIPPVAGG